MTTITKEWLQQTIAEFENTRDDIPFGLSDDDAKILIVLKRALASLTAEPVLYAAEETLAYAKMGELHLTCLSEPMGDAVIPLYTAPPVQETGVYKDMLNIIGLLENNEWTEHCTSTVLGSLLESEITRLVSKEQQAPERERIRRKHAEWSDKTFGDVGPVGPLKHLSKEALEAAADPSDPLEWADMQFLLWDAQRRMGISDEFITRAMIEKLEINKSRQWPEPKDGEPRLHIKEQPVPVVPEERPSLNNGIVGFDEGWNACRAAMLQGVEQPQNARQNIPENIPDGNSPAIPDDWVMVPKEPTQAMIKAWLSEVANFRGHAAGYKAALAAAPQREVK
ncbi:DUF550 domain-containing protein [Salmonella enterica]|nr:DUF550 domain-containing protein [Salmonella enterica]